MDNGKENGNYYSIFGLCSRVLGLGDTPRGLIPQPTPAWLKKHKGLNNCHYHVGVYFRSPILKFYKESGIIRSVTVCALNPKLP